MTLKKANLWCTQNGVQIATRGGGWGTMVLDGFGMTLSQPLADGTFDTWASTFLSLTRKLRIMSARGSSRRDALV